MPETDDISARALLRQRDYLFFLGTRWAGSFTLQIQSVTLGWQMYAVARETQSVQVAAMMVGMIGLATFVPLFFLALPAGEMVDRHNRKRIVLACLAGQATSVSLLIIATANNFVSIPVLLICAALFGASRAFFNPATQALGPMLVPRALLPRALAWSSLSAQTANIAGPAAAGILLTQSPLLAYAAALALYFVSAVSISMVRGNTTPIAQPGSRWTLIKEGLVYVWRAKIVFGAITLDLCAVLLGGATALLPAFARDVLHVGADGFGLLRSSPAMGATLVALILAVRPVRGNAGLVMLGGVATFGLATIIFGLSRSLWLSMAALALLGAADMISVYVRQTLVQLVTPDPMRGRVSAVSSLFIGASNELGEVESGLIARLLGPVGAALFGGVGAIAITGVWAKLFPDLRKADRLI
ncbi:MFS transporter [Phenylobacterium immobile]|uniref:MFS transporter n=1 Tax=Phenylobacterium immobile TaxID=21 RepID=UPI000AA93CB5|nr:MFS transporter [Phenylobacterium immobile]